MAKSYWTFLFERYARWDWWRMEDDDVSPKSAGMTSECYKSVRRRCPTRVTVVQDRIQLFKKLLEDESGLLSPAKRCYSWSCSYGITLTAALQHPASQTISQTKNLCSHRVLKRLVALLLNELPSSFFFKGHFHHLWEISQPLNGWRSWVWAGIWHLQLIPTLCLALWGDLSPECIVNERLNIFSEINIKISLVISLHLMSWISVNTNIHLAVIFFSFPSELLSYWDRLVCFLYNSSPWLFLYFFVVFNRYSEVKIHANKNNILFVEFCIQSTLLSLSS